MICTTTGGRSADHWLCSGRGAPRAPLRRPRRATRGPHRGHHNRFAQCGGPVRTRPRGKLLLLRDTDDHRRATPVLSRPRLVYSGASGAQGSACSHQELSNAAVPATGPGTAIQRDPRRALGIPPTKAIEGLQATVGEVMRPALRVTALGRREPSADPEDDYRWPVTRRRLDRELDARGSPATCWLFSPRGCGGRPTTFGETASFLECAYVVETRSPVVPWWRI